ncbi:MAG: hypothetical protein PVI89_09485 [Desulfobacteraceae bacterium]|jgi:hypothetical protein
MLHTQMPAYKQLIPGHAPVDCNPSEMLAFNQMLNRDARSLLNETIIENRIHQAFQLQIHSQRIFWLTLARITELAIYQAGVYADACEFTAAGDLLVNPRRIDVHLKGRKRSVVKHRHSRLSGQFAADIGRESPVCWLAREATPRLTSDAILPWLRRTLASSGAMAGSYIKSLDRRMGQVADTLAFLIAWRIEDAVEFHQRTGSMDLHERAFIESNLCRFDTGHFDAMYADTEAILYAGRCPTRFLA